MYGISRLISFHSLGVINRFIVDGVCFNPSGTALRAILDIALGVDLVLVMLSIAIGPAIKMLVARITSTITSLSSLEGVLNSLVIAVVNSFHNENVADLYRIPRNKAWKSGLDIASDTNSCKSLSP